MRVLAPGRNTNARIARARAASQTRTAPFAARLRTQSELSPRTVPIIR